MKLIHANLTYKNWKRQVISNVELKVGIQVELEMEAEII